MKAALALLIALASPAAAAVESSAADGFTSLHSATVAIAPDALWQKLVDWGGWWPAAHSYSGSAASLKLDAKAGGLLTEQWDGNSVLHGSVLQALPARRLRLNAPFGPLQALPVNAVLDIQIAAEGTGSRITMRYRVGGPASLKLDTLAAPVDNVLAEAFQRLAR